MSISVIPSLVPISPTLHGDELQSVARWLFADEINGIPRSVMQPFRRLVHNLHDPQVEFEDIGRMLDCSRPLVPLLQTLYRGNWNSLGREALSNEPTSTTLDHVKRFALFGFDFKITPDNNPQIIEINGINSGMKGYARSQSTLLDQDGQVIRAQKYLDKIFQTYGESQAAYIGTILALSGQESSRFPAIKDLFKDELRVLMGQKQDSLWEYAVHREWHSRYYQIGSDLAFIEQFLEDKVLCDYALEPWRTFKPRSFEFSDEGFEELLATYNPRLVVCKDQSGSLGKDIVIAPADQIMAEARKEFSVNKRILEPFIESQAIYSPISNDYHDGCARYIIHAEVKKSGEVVLNDIGGYWRLSPEPLSAKSTDSLVANIARKAQAIPLSDIHREIMSELAQAVAQDLIVRLPEQNPE